MAFNETEAPSLATDLSELLGITANATPRNEELQQFKKNVDDIFLLTNGIIVCLMQCGFACLEAGAVRSKNVTNIIMKNLMDIFVSALFYWLVGYALAYGKGNQFLGLELWASVGLPSDRMAHWFFQFVFAATAATIVSGAVAERCQYVAYLIYSAVISGFLYPVVSHWVWTEQGWLQRLGYRDFAGSGAVHMLAGAISLVAAAVLGPRAGRFPGCLRAASAASTAPGKWSPAADSAVAALPKGPIPGHSVPLVGLGGMTLIAGFLAFNGGSLGRMSGPGDSQLVARVMVNTVMGGAGGSLMALAVARVGLAGAPAAFGFANTLNASFAGMVSVCAAADIMTFWSSFISGIVAAVVYLTLHNLVIYCRVDDPLDTVGVHLGGGLWGVFVAAFFAEGGLVYGISYESSMAVAYQLAGATAIFIWSVCLSLIMFGTMRCVGIFRVSLEDELQGLDVALHAEAGYPPEAWSIQLAGAILPFKAEKTDEKPTYKKPESCRPTSEYNNMAFEETENIIIKRITNS
ncbi:putative ammonium transporter 1 [Schistocerca gregaria]|uniref:putative ammonium transporter 1 n=1 Tax=Schistocerca gregaria TaxID=7010 RepID=UPI00211E4D9F|nr:putative ammonium transporter 1 [Schistocerca gregaria]